MKFTLDCLVVPPANAGTSEVSELTLVKIMLITHVTDKTGLEDCQPEVTVVGPVDDMISLIHLDYYLTTSIRDCVPFLSGLIRDVEANDWHQTEMQIDENFLLSESDLLPPGFSMERTGPIAELGGRITRSLFAREDQCVPAISWNQFGYWMSIDEDGCIGAICSTVFTMLKAGPYVRSGRYQVLQAREEDKYMPTDDLKLFFNGAFDVYDDTWLGGDRVEQA